MAKRHVIRASDSERDAVAERLRHAAAEGRLLASELEHRLALALRARTIGELDALVTDLPGTRRPRRSRPPAVRLVSYAAISIAVVGVVALAALIIAGLFAAWMTWAVVAWFLFGRHHGRRGPRARHYGRSQLRTARRPLL